MDKLHPTTTITHLTSLASDTGQSEHGEASSSQKKPPHGQVCREAIYVDFELNLISGHLPSRAKNTLSRFLACGFFWQWLLPQVALVHSIHKYNKYRHCSSHRSLQAVAPTGRHRLCGYVFISICECAGCLGLFIPTQPRIFHTFFGLNFTRQLDRLVLCFASMGERHSVISHFVAIPLGDML